ncbi:MAG TPA: aldehyde dehydrogenase family protein [Solirubrobacteraceae bacterium]|nr:aldehyde dehydrogenase family protein [Solirubrobacteraceae bacterium]
MSATTESTPGVAANSAAAVSPLLDERAWTGRIYSGGWVDAPETIETVEPATGDVLGKAGAADGAAVSAACAAAAEAQPEWAAMAATDRVAIVARAAQLLERHRPELERWLIRESGSIPGKAAQEITASAGQLQMAAALISHPLGHVLPSLTPGRTSIARRVPIGVVGVITPWNFPYVLAMRSVGPALALGNAVVLKADPNTPVTGGVVIARIFEEAGLPAGVLHVLPGGAEAGAALCSDPRVRMISFTGSTATGRAVGAAAGGSLKRLVLELGGNSPLVVLDDADIVAASSAGAWGSFLHQGQICLAVSRHLVHERIAEAYVEALVERASHLPVGDPNTQEVALGPIINEKQVARVQRIVDETVAAGAEALIGGTADGLFYKPTVLGGVTAEMAAFRDEIFGPVAPVITFADDDEAVALANQTEYGLAAAVQSGSPQRAARVAERLHAGMVHINDQTVNEEPPAPFGGFGASSNGGHFGGVANLELWTEWQWMTAREAAEPFPF